METNDYHEKYFEVLTDSLEGKESLIKLRDIYKEIFGIQAIFVTTNVDTHLHKQFDPTLDLTKIIYKENDFDPLRIELSKIYQIHGTILDRDSMVFTSSDYLSRYKENGKIKPFLEEIFQKYVVLFVGYGLSEFEVLDFLVLKTDPTQNREALLKEERKKKYIVLPFFHGEDNILEFVNYYYDSLGIEVIPYEIDKQGYDQLYELIKDWNIQIRNNTPIILAFNKNTDDVLKNFDIEKARKLFGSLRPNSPQEKYFLSQLGKIENPTDWFDLLKEKGYFDPKNNPRGNEASRYFWMILIYLENYTNNIVSNPSENRFSSIFEIFDAVIDYKDESGRPVENDFTDYKLFCMVFSLPPEKITDKYFEFFKNCLKSENSRILISSEISQKVLSKFLKENNREITSKLIDIIFDFKEGSESELNPIRSLLYDNSIQEHYLYEIFEKFTDEIINVCGDTAFKLALKKTEIIVATHPQLMEYYIIRSVNVVSKPSQNDNYPSLIVQFLGNFLIKCRVPQLMSILLTDFLSA